MGIFVNTLPQVPSSDVETDILHSWPTSENAIIQASPISLLIFLHASRKSAGFIPLLLDV